MANPRFALSTEDRSCGPLGRKVRRDAGEFTSMKPWTPGTPKIAFRGGIRKKKRLQRTRKEVFDYFELEDTQVA